MGPEGVEPKAILRRSSGAGLASAPGHLDPSDAIAKRITIIGDDPHMDLLTHAWSVRYADAPRLLRTSIDGMGVPFVDIDTLIRSKQTGRLPDQAEVEALARIKGPPASVVLIALTIPE